MFVSRQPLDPVVVRFTGGLLGPPVRNLIPGDPFVRGASADLDLDRMLPLA